MKLEKLEEGVIYNHEKNNYYKLDIERYEDEEDKIVIKAKSKGSNLWETYFSIKDVHRINRERREYRRRLKEVKNKSKREAVKEFSTYYFQNIPQELIKKAYPHKFEPVTWGTQFLPGNFVRDKIEDIGIEKVEEKTGFTIQEIDDHMFLGIDGAGYDFYSNHWEKLYDLLDLKWHK